jgi:GH35 family endo-1,4-beta-xylanase
LACSASSACVAVGNSIPHPGGVGAKASASPFLCHHAMLRSLLAATLLASPALAATASFDPDDGYNLGRSISGQPNAGPQWAGSGELFTVVPADGGGAAQSAATDVSNFANLRLVPPGLQAAGKVPFSLKIRSDTPPTSEDFSGAWFVRIGHDADGEQQGDAVRIGIFDNGIVQTENQSGGDTVRMLDAQGDAVDLDDHTGRFLPIEGVIDFDAGTYTLSFDGVPQTLDGNPNLPFAATGHDAFGMISLNAWNSDDPQARQITIDDLSVGDAEAADVVGEAPRQAPVPAARPRPAGEGLPAGGRSILPEDAVAAFFAGNYGPDENLATAEVVELAEGPADRALRVTVGKNPAPEPQPWHVEVKTRQIAPTNGGDVTHLRFWARTIASQHETAAAEFTVYYQHAGRPYDASFMYTATPGSEWERFDIPFEVLRTYGEGSAELNFAAGLREQTFELAGIEMVHYGSTDVAVEDLPRTSQQYEGRADDAAWRAEALERIEELRTAPLRLQFLDRNGNPVEGGEARVKMTKNAFQFGSAINAEIWVRDTPDAKKYREEALRLFNTASTENGLKIHRWYDLQHRWETMQMLADLDAANMTIHGHVLVWPSWRKTRIDLDRAKAMAEAGDVRMLRWITNEFIRDVMIDTQDYIDAWDVMNEPWNNNDFMAILGEDEMASWFRQAEQYRPDADRFINDFGILNGPPVGKNGHAQEYLRVIRKLIDDDAPLDAIGFQSHFGGPVGISQLKETIAAFEPFGKRMMITEFDARIADDEAYADYLRDLLILSYSHPQFDGFIMWGFWDETHWLKNAPLFDEDWSPKAGLRTWEQWVLGEWRTDETVRVAHDGTATTTGHLGTYDVTHAGQTWTVTLASGGSDHTLRLE